MCDARASTFAQLILRMARQCISPGVWGACWSCRTNYIFEDEGGEQLFKPRLRAPEKPSFDCWSRTAGLQPLYALESVSNFLSPPSSLTLCFLLSLHKSPDVSPPAFHGPLPGQGLLVRVSPRPARRPQQARRQPAVAVAVAEAAGPGRVNQCFPIRADMHFTRRDSPQPAN